MMSAAHSGNTDRSPSAPEGIILQRFVPHYRAPLFARLYETYGWVTVCSNDHEKSLGIHVETGGEYLRPWPIKLYRNGRMAASGLGPMLEAFKPRLIISEFSLNISWCYEIALRKQWGLRLPPVAYYTHGLSSERAPQGKAGLFERARIGVLAKADVIACYTAERCESIRRFAPTLRAMSLSNTIDTAPILKLADSTARKPLALDRTGPRLIVVNRLVANKRVDIVIQAAGLLATRFGHAQLQIVGDGPERSDLERRAAGSVAAVQFLGAVHDQVRLAELFADSDLAVIGGSAGLFVNQALASGVPVVLFDNPGEGQAHHPEHVYVREGETGYRVQEVTAEALAETIAQAFMDGQSPAETLRPRLRQYVEQELTIEKMVSDFGKVREALLHPGRTRELSDS